MARLHVTFLALRRGSRFAAQEFAIVATEAYERGVTIPSLRMDISLLGLSTASDMGLSEQDAFLSHLGMCMMTLWELDWPSRGAPAGGGARWSPVGGDPEDDREARGLLAYIRATHQRSDAGFTLKRMEMERIMTLQARGSGAPDAWAHPEGWGDTQRLNRDEPDDREKTTPRTSPHLKEASRAAAVRKTRGPARARRDRRNASDARELPTDAPAARVRLPIPRAAPRRRGHQRA